MEVTEDVLAHTPAGNLRVPRAEFAAVWVAAERLNRESGERRMLAWYPAGVAVTCRWLAGAVIEDQMHRRSPAPAPVSRRRERAYEELIEAEFLAAALLANRCPWLVERHPGWCEAIRATLRWAWRREGPPPLAVDASLASVIPMPSRPASIDAADRHTGANAAAAGHGYTVPRS